MRLRIPVLALNFLLALCALTQSVHATTVLPVNLDGLIDQAALIFTGTAVHREVVLSRDGTFPFTFVTFRVDETFKGEVRHREVTLRFHGGKVGDQVMVVVGTPEFEVGERYLLFLADNGTSQFPVVGWRQGQYRFAREPRSGASVLIDDQGRALGGIERGQWHRRALPSMDGPAAPDAVLLSEEGVEVSQVPLEVGDRPDRIPEAWESLAALRKQARSRSKQPTFVPGRVVESARPEDVPARVDWKSIPPR